MFPELLLEEFPPLEYVLLLLFLPEYIVSLPLFLLFEFPIFVAEGLGAVALGLLEVGGLFALVVEPACVLGALIPSLLGDLSVVLEYIPPSSDGRLSLEPVDLPFVDTPPEPFLLDP